MTLDEAIEHAEWCARNSCGECAEEHQQLAEWLKELKALRTTKDRLAFLLMTFMEGVNAALCTDYDMARCREECPMHIDESGCVWTRAYDLLNELGIEVDDGR